MLLIGNATLPYTANKQKEISVDILDILEPIVLKLEPFIVIVFASLLVYKLATYQEPKSEPNNK